MTISPPSPDIQAIQKDLDQIIDRHFSEVEIRLDRIRQEHFISFRPVFKRHMRNLGDVPRDLLVLPRTLLGLVLRPMRLIPGCRSIGLPRQRAHLSGKTREIETLIVNDFLDISGLEQAIASYVDPYRHAFEQELSQLVLRVPALRREDFGRELEKRLADLTTPVDGAREAVMFLTAGVLGKCLSDKVIFGSALGGGQAAAIALYLSQASWMENLLVYLSLSSIPGWVGVAGAAGGLAAVALTAPLLAPVLEVGVNRLRSRKVLLRILVQARQGLQRTGPDGANLAGRVAIYLQLLPDTLQMARSLLPRLM